MNQVLQLEYNLPSSSYTQSEFLSLVDRVIEHSLYALDVSRGIKL